MGVLARATHHRKIDQGRVPASLAANLQVAIAAREHVVAELILPEGSKVPSMMLAEIERPVPRWLACAFVGKFAPYSPCSATERNRDLRYITACRMDRDRLSVSSRRHRQVGRKTGTVGPGAPGRVVSTWGRTFALRPIGSRSTVELHSRPCLTDGLETESELRPRDHRAQS